jgi:CubicO group peptidase (beta-lactamase class C family)
VSDRARHGKLVFEEYYFGHAADQPHDLRSAGKTFASVLLGGAMMQGAPIAPESTITSVMRREGTLAIRTRARTALRSRSCSRTRPGSPATTTTATRPVPRVRCQSQTKLRDWWKYTLDLPVAHDPGSHYAYCSGGMNLVGGAISAATDRWLPEVFDSLLARPLALRATTTI